MCVWAVYCYFMNVYTVNENIPTLLNGENDVQNSQIAFSSNSSLTQWPSLMQMCKQMHTDQMEYADVLEHSEAGKDN